MSAWRARLAAIREGRALADDGAGAVHLPPKGANDTKGAIGIGIKCPAGGAGAPGRVAVVAEAPPYALLARERLLRHPSWSNPASTPPPGAWCSCCGRFTPEAGGRWWREAKDPSGWRCTTCHPPPPRVAVVEIRT